jgi:hypothetical protein
VISRGIERHMKSVKLPGRSEVIVEVLVEGEYGAEGIINKMEIAEGIYVANSLTRTKRNKAIASILNTRDEEVRRKSLV